MTKQLFRLTLFLFISLSIPLIATAQIVNIPDPNLRAAIEDALNKASGAPITASDMKTLTNLRTPNANISDLTGLENATNLTWLWLRSNSISDISPLTGLNKLTSLLLDDNSITDISPLAGLNQLTTLWLHHNSITDISPLAGLNKLTRLLLNNNSITDISPLAELNQLTQLWLRSNSITDISPLAGLNKLTSLLLDNNSITDISPLAELNQLTNLGLRRNSISDISPLAGLTNLEILDLARNSLSDISPLAGLTNLGIPDLGNNSISDISPLVENTGLGSEDFVNLTENPLNALSINTHIPALLSRGVIVAFYNVVARSADVNGDGVVNIFDLVSVAANFGKLGQNLAEDVNGDSAVNILDLILVAGRFGDTAAAPSVQPQSPEILTAAAVRGWLTDTQALGIRDPIMKRGVVVLEQLLASLTPTETQLLPNYPNPFNPETWIPYRLAEDAFVTLTIYDRVGQVVRTIDIGHQTAAFYENRSQAIYWDGRNQVGEPVASGVYFYHLSTSDFSATRKMLILK